MPERALFCTAAKQHYSLLSVEAVFGLVENDGLWRIYHLVGHFLAAVCREAVHENRVRLRSPHQRRVYLVRHEFRDTRPVFVFPPHRGPDIRVDDVGSFNGLNIFGSVGRAA